MNIETLKAEYPELVEAITAEATEGMAAAVDAAMVAGAQSERDRIAAVRATAIPGHEALIEAVAFDGVSTAADAALAIVGAEKQLRIGAAAVLDAEAPPLVPAIDADAAAVKTIKRGDFNALRTDEQRAVIDSGTKISD